MRFAYFVVEGPHDLVVVGRLLRERGFETVRSFETLNEYWHRLVPRAFPYDGDLLRRVPVPTFYQSRDCSVAIRTAQGSTPSVLKRTINTDLIAMDPEPAGIGIIVDADYEMAVDARWKGIAEHLGFDSGDGPGSVGSGHPRVGIYILPDNFSQGTLEDLLLECAEQAYPTLLEYASGWVRRIDPQDTTIFANAEEAKDFRAPAGPNKAVVSSIASILRPGKAIQVSIHDNRWLRDEAALATESVRALDEFVGAIIG